MSGQVRSGQVRSGQVRSDHECILSHIAQALNLPFCASTLEPLADDIPCLQINNSHRIHSRFKTQKGSALRLLSILLALHTSTLLRQPCRAFSGPLVFASDFLLLFRGKLASDILICNFNTTSSKTLSGRRVA